MTTKTVNGEKVNVYTVDELHNFVYQVLAFGRGVTDWEQKFMKDIECHKGEGMKLSERLYWFAQRHYWASPVIDRVRWWLERRGK